MEFSMKTFPCKQKSSINGLTKVLEFIYNSIYYDFKMDYG